MLLSILPNNQPVFSPSVEDAVLNKALKAGDTPSEGFSFIVESEQITV